MASALATLTSALKLLSDPVRLRLCGLLAQNELAVQEMVAATGMQQSRISNHLAQLKRAGLVRDRREGTWSFHSLVEPSEQGPLTPQMHAAAIEPWLSSDEGKRDLTALARVLEQRREKSRSAHDRLAERWESGQEFAQGSLRSEVMAMAWPRSFVVADLGCGTGFLASQLAPFAHRVIAVDHSPRMLEAAKKKSLPRNCEFRRGELDALPIEDATVDAAFANLVWHHLPDLAAAAREVLRILKPGGAVVISDLLPHENEWMREGMGDLRLGLKPEQVVAALAAAGFHSLRWERASDRYRIKPPDGGDSELPMFLVRGQKPAVGDAGSLS